MADSYSVFNSSGLPSFGVLFKQILALKYFCCTNNQTPSVEPIQPRHRPCYMTPSVRTHYGRAAREYYIPAIFNELPDEMVSLSTRKQRRAIILAIEYCSSLYVYAVTVFVICSLSKCFLMMCKLVMYTRVRIGYQSVMSFAEG